MAWVLAAVLRGAPVDLLDTYETERWPVVNTFAEQSVADHFLRDRVTSVVGVTNRSLQRSTRWPCRLAIPALGR